MTEGESPRTHGDDASPPARQAQIVITDETPEAMAAPVAIASVVRFCNRCGDRLNSETNGCQTCEAAASSAVAIPAVLPAGDTEYAAIRSAMALYFALLTVSLILIIWIIAAGKKAVPVETEWIASGAISLIALGWALKWRATIRPLLTTLGRLWTYPAAIVFGTATFIVASLIVSGLSHQLHVERLDYLGAYETGGYTFAWAVLWICVQPAIFEELAFRGVILSALDRALTPREASIVTALLFGILHLSVPSLLHLTTLGLLLAFLRRRSGSLYPCMLMHFTHNLLVLLNERNGWTPW